MRQRRINPAAEPQVGEKLNDDEISKNSSKAVTDTSSPRTSLVAVWSLGHRLYTRGGDRSVRPLLLQALLLVVLLICNTGVSLWFSFVLRAFTTALQEKKETDFYLALADVTKVIAVMVPAHAGKSYASGYLSLFLRRRFTKELFREYFNNKAYFHLQAENASLRLLEVEAWIQEVQKLFTVVLQKILDLVAFSSLMFFLSFRLFGALFTYSLVGSFVSVWYFFPRLTAILAEVTAKRAQVVYALVRVYENKESIAFYSGDSRELSILSKFLDAFLTAARKHLQWNIGLASFQEAYSYATIVLPYLVVAPLYFAGEIEYGVVSQSSMAFSRIKEAMNLLVNNFDGLATIAASTRRLRELLDEMDRFPKREILEPSEVVDAMVRVDSLVLHTPPPSGQLLCTGLSLELRAGESMLIMGSSGGGKSSLLRCFAGLWDPTEGTVAFGCAKACISFLPQQPYMPIGTLRDVLTYPNEPNLPHDEDEDWLLRGLEQAELPDLAPRVGGLDALVPWTEMLSHGEQQRIAFARLFLRPPSAVLLDEASSALDTATESTLYSRLLSLEPKPTIISVGHRDSLRRFHQSVLVRKDDASSVWDFEVPKGDPSVCSKPIVSIGNSIAKAA
eukprot:TRINITY_DN5233_c0_g2_i1.p1 TRINITY_DN5233_c0_g2~~TRINITY_DN5233_c0_g2_i1.p1  ORF type:complete len:619 (+),score=92.50 TRINITY_DN5233_c0_g2_i1:268-2124(+)